MVLGMHRSGTSALAGMLGLAGASLPAHLMPATDANARGFFESQRLFELHEELLAELCTSWHDVSPPPPGFLRSRAAARWVGRLADAVEEEFGDAPLFVVKDPRVCRLVPLWERVLERVGVRPVYLLAMRNPLEIAVSLQREHQIEEGAGLLLWLDHVLRSERDTRGRPRIVVSYESLLDDWRRVLRRTEQQLGISFPRLSRGSEAEIDRFLSGSLRNQHAQSASLEKRADLTDWVKQVHEWAVQADRDGDLLPEVLDPIADAMIEAERAFGPVLASSQLAFRELSSEAARLREALDDVRCEHDRRDEELAKAQVELAESRDQTASLRAGLSDREGQLEEARDERIRRDEELAKSNTELALAHTEAVLLRANLKNREEQSDRLFDWAKILLPWVAQLVSGRPISREEVDELMTALETAAPAERLAAATAGLRWAVQTTRIEELEEDRRRYEGIEAELQLQLVELEKRLAESADRGAEELRALDRRAAALRVEFVVAVERAERRELELALQAESHASEVAALVGRADERELEFNALVEQIADERMLAQAETADLELCLERVRLQLAALEQSRTWRWSRPVRWLGGERR